MKPNLFHKQAAQGPGQAAAEAAGVRAVEQSFTSYNVELGRVKQFKYFGRILIIDGNNLLSSHPSQPQGHTKDVASAAERPCQEIRTRTGGWDILLNCSCRCASEW